MAMTGISEAELAEFVRRTSEANTLFMRGEMDRYVAMVPHTADYTLMAPFGGAPVRGFDSSPERLAEMGWYFRGGSSVLELTEAYGSGDLVVLVGIERQQGQVGGLPEQAWSLRVTLVYRREEGEWRLAHRHADPLVRNIGLERAAEIARG